MTGARDVDLIRRMEALESEMYGPNRDAGIKGKVADLWEWRAMGKGAAWVILKVGAVVASAGVLFWAFVETALD